MLKLTTPLVLSIIYFAMLLIALITLSCCTISFQNIHTNGNAEDLVDDTQHVSPNIKTNLKLPLLQ